MCKYLNALGGGHDGGVHVMLHQLVRGLGYIFIKIKITFFYLNINDMSQMFENCVLFNSDLSSWNVSNMFTSDLSQWDVGNVIYTFNSFNSFNGFCKKIVTSLIVGLFCGT